VIILSQLKEKTGFALPLVLFIILIFGILITGLVGLVNQQTVYARFNQNQLNAQYIAESGARVGIRRVLNILDNNNNHPENVATYDGNAFFHNNSDPYHLNYKYDAGNGTVTSPERIEVTVSATINSYTAHAKAYIIFNPKYVPGYIPPDVIDLISDANKLNDKAKTNDPEFKGKYTCFFVNGNTKNNKNWYLGKERDRDFGRPNNGDEGYSYILFDDVISDKFRIDYNFKFIKSSGSGGAGVLYGVGNDDIANNFTSYAVRFNNNMGAFSVNKLVETAGATEPTQQLFYSTNPHDMDQSTRKGWGYMIQPNGNGTTTLDIDSDKNKTDPLGNKVGRCSITFDDLETAMEIYYAKLKAEGKKLPDGRDVPRSFDPRANEQEYMITVETAYEEVTVQPGTIIWKKNADGTTNTYTNNPDGEKVSTISSWQKVGGSYKENRLRQTIMIDGNPVLSFIDFSDVYTMENYYTKDWRGRLQTQAPSLAIQRGAFQKINIGTTHTRTGLRVANVRQSSIKFYTTPDLGYGHWEKDYSKIIWKK
jgi:type II secretory pathway pseudopilin PulG